MRWNLRCLSPCFALSKASNSISSHVLFLIFMSPACLPVYTWPSLLLTKPFHHPSLISSHSHSHHFGLPLHDMLCHAMPTALTVYCIIHRPHDNIQTPPQLPQNKKPMHYVGVDLPLECDMLYGASTFFALQILQANLRTLPSACTTSGANSMPNICWIA